MAYTTIDDPSKYHQTMLYTGNGASRSLTNDGNSDLQPDWIWVKRRDDVGNNNVIDSTRGVTKLIFTQSDDDEETLSDRVTSFDSDGFSTGNEDANINTATYVAWQWKANGGTRTTNTESGDNPGGGYQANTTAGFSIVDYTGTGAVGTMAHGLGAVPKMIIIKTRAVGNWNVYHKGIAATHYLLLSTNAAKADDDSRFNDTDPTSTVFTLGATGDVNGNDTPYIAYCFAEKQGYSKIGTFTGNGDTEGPFVYTGFKPAWIIYKRAGDGTNNWGQIDNRRDIHNPCINAAAANLNNAHGESSNNGSGDMLSNGWKILASAGSRNASGVQYIYMAFAEHPFVSSEGVPVTAR